MPEVPDILPFSLEIRPGLPVFEQLAYAVRKALMAGLLKPGDRFPSVRTMSRELRIHPNTVQKAVTVLVNEGLLDVHPGVGTVIARHQPSSTKESRRQLTEDVERLVVEAKRTGVSLDELHRFVTKQWNQLQ